MQNHAINKPITLLREDFVQNLQNLCNSSKLPYFVIRDVFREFLPLLQNTADAEMRKDANEYKEMLEKQENAKRETEKLVGENPQE